MVVETGIKGGFMEIKYPFLHFSFKAMQELGHGCVAACQVAGETPYSVCLE